ncbi:LRR receptor-like serine/threonine-protein kinase GSO2 [Morella rubra]|uniref:LRR receptor-like serine/threonine-protein kinase GSO2 n=1 Tax=Morella rubra TaxID=262757 RepID=A0A6A1W1H8_9ROSI|nr:LRR receptor-like serine/threonine-protein kinase GSO2 [Morella rubra]
MGLLNLKKAFMESYSYIYGFASWIEDPKSECCAWERITCDSTTGRVIKLSLKNGKRDSYYFHRYSINGTPDQEYWLLNVSLFLPFKELRSLDLSGHKIRGWIANEGFERLTVLRKLETLNLQWNKFEDSIISSIAALTSIRTLRIGAGDFESLSRLENLETLDIDFVDRDFNRSAIRSLIAVKSLKNLVLSGGAGTQFSGGPFPARELSVLKNLEKLDLSWNDLNGSLTTQECRGLSNMTKLMHLDLSYNLFDKDILRCLGALPALQSLHLQDNRMEGRLPIEDLANLTTLEILDMSFNYFTGSIPPDIGSLYSLKALSLTNNNLSGTLHTQDLANLTTLEILDMSFNYFTGSIPPDIGSLYSLKALSLTNNNLVAHYIQLTRLEELDLSWNQLEGILPPCLKNMTSLKYIDLGHNLFEGSFSISLFANHSKLEAILLENGNNKLDIETEDPVGWEPLFQLKILALISCNLNKRTGHFPRLQILSLRNNKFMGRFGLPPDLFMDITWIDVSNNLLDGQLQENIGKLSPLLRYLNLSQNHFEGNVPSSVGSWSYLEALDLFYNNFSGEVPKELIGNCTSLILLRLSNNGFHGKIFSKHFKLFSLQRLQLNNNQLTGTLSKVLLSCAELTWLDVSNNNMSGTIPPWIRNMPMLTILSMRNNFFKGQIPCELRSLWLIDLSHNSLSGTLPSCLNLDNARHILLQGNKLTGSIPKVIFNSSSLLTLDIRGNNFSGSIPDEIRALSDLRILLLRGNHFSGRVPNQLCQLKRISIMDLSKNSFYGHIPSCFHNISFGKLEATFLVYQDSSVSVPSEYLVYESLLGKIYVGTTAVDLTYDAPVEIQFTTKHRFDSFKNSILDYISGLDLSCNKLTGNLPSELGQLSSILALNLSHNQLIGSIPKTLSNMNMLESLDLSSNNLSGEIPSALADMTFLEVFSVAHNNLSGRLPDMRLQFATFDNSSYQGNPFLCGLPLDKICSRVEDGSHSTPTKFSNGSDGKWYEVDPRVFFVVKPVMSVDMFCFHKRLRQL